MHLRGMCVHACGAARRPAWPKARPLPEAAAGRAAAQPVCDIWAHLHKESVHSASTTACSMAPLPPPLPPLPLSPPPPVRHLLHRLRASDQLLLLCSDILWCRERPQRARSRRSRAAMEEEGSAPRVRASSISGMSQLLLQASGWGLGGRATGSVEPALSQAPSSLSAVAWRWLSDGVTHVAAKPLAAGTPLPPPPPPLLLPLPLNVLPLPLPQGWAMLADSCPVCGVSGATVERMVVRPSSLCNGCCRVLPRNGSDQQRRPSAPFPAAGPADALARRRTAAVHQLRLRHHS